MNSMKFRAEVVTKTASGQKHEIWAEQINPLTCL